MRGTAAVSPIHGQSFLGALELTPFGFEVATKPQVSSQYVIGLYLKKTYKSSNFQYVGDFDLLGDGGAVSSGDVGSGKSSPFSEGAIFGVGFGASKTESSSLTVLGVGWASGHSPYTRLGMISTDSTAGEGQVSAAPALNFPLSWPVCGAPKLAG